jgi:hypothetical protein
MKSAIKFFSMYLMVLACLPCSDTVADFDVNHSTKEVSHQEKHNHENSVDLCSPFCSCACCGIQIATFENPSFIFIQNRVFTSQKAKINRYQSIYLSKTSDKIWQPPKINV